VKWLSRILMLLSVATIITHSSIAHHHHEDLTTLAHHDHDSHHNNKSHDHNNSDDNDNQHNFFSFVQLDEDFIPSKYGKLSIEVPVLYLLTPITTLRLSELRVITKTFFGYYREYPPPICISSNLFSRPPPIC
jgi:hypothetical protein